MTDKDFPFDNTSRENGGNENDTCRQAEDNEGSRKDAYAPDASRQTGYREDGAPFGEASASSPDGGSEYYPYAGSGARPQAAYKIPLRVRVKKFFYEKKVVMLSLLSAICGSALLAYHLLSYILSSVISRSQFLNELYFSDAMFKNFFGMLYSMICVALPFGAAYFLLKRVGIIELPLDAPKKGSGLPLLIIGGMGIFYIGNVLTTILITTLSDMGIELYSYTSTVETGADVPESIFMFIVMTVHSAVIPAFVEEFAFRGVIMQPLRKYGDWFAIVLSAVLFGLLHGNMMQMPFAVVAGVVLGYVTVVTGSMWTGIILHFLNNFCSMVYSIIGELLSDGVKVVFSSVYTYGIIIIGIVAFAGFTIYNPRFYRLYPSKVKGLDTKRAAGVYTLLPPMLAAIIFMVISVVGDMYFA